MIFRLVFLSSILGISSCSNKNLRGEVTKSNDGGTYLVFVEDCGPGNTIYIDDQLWGKELGQKGGIMPGIHKIKCGGELSIEILEGDIFYFDYWGP